MLVQHHNAHLVSVYVSDGENAGEVYRIPGIIEIIRHNEDGTIFTHIRVNKNPVICAYFDLNFMRMTFRKCHIWFTKQQYKGKVKIVCGEYPVPIDEMQFTAEDVTYTY